MPSSRHGTSTSEINDRNAPDAVDVKVTDDMLTVSLSDGRVISTPLVWYPRLIHSTKAERNNWRIIGGGYGIHWPDPDEHLSVVGMLRGNPSMESPASFERWLAARSAARKPSSKRQPRRATKRRARAAA